MVETGLTREISKPQHGTNGWKGKETDTRAYNYIL